MTPPTSPSPKMVEVAATAMLARRGFTFYDNPMEGGQDAYDISCEALEDARLGLTAALRLDALDAEPEGWLFHNPDTGVEYSDDHPVESGQVSDAENIRPATVESLKEALFAAWHEIEATDRLVPPDAGQVQPVVPEDEETCIACGKFLTIGQMVLPDASGGLIHTDCCGPERESYTGATGGPLAEGEQIPAGLPYATTPSPKAEDGGNHEDAATDMDRRLGSGSSEQGSRGDAREHLPRPAEPVSDRRRLRVDGDAVFGGGSEDAVAPKAEDVREAVATQDPRKPCDICDGQRYADSWTSACSRCLGTGYVTPELIAGSHHATVVRREEELVAEIEKLRDMLHFANCTCDITLERLDAIRASSPDQPQAGPSAVDVLRRLEWSVKGAHCPICSGSNPLIFPQRTGHTPTCDIARVLSGAETGRVEDMRECAAEWARQANILLADLTAAEARATKAEADLQAVTTKLGEVSLALGESRAAVRTLREALEPPAKLADHFASQPDECLIIVQLNWLRRARAALQATATVEG